MLFKKAFSMRDDQLKIGFFYSVVVHHEDEPLYLPTQYVPERQRAWDMRRYRPHTQVSRPR
jgi:hypothetical protein